MYFFLGFVIASLIGGRILDKRGARPAVVLGGAVGAVGFYLLAGKLTDLSLSHQWVYVSIAGAGIGLMITPASTDALNRAPSAEYSEVTGITQTARNLGASLGLAVLGAILISESKTKVSAALTHAERRGSQSRFVLQRRQRASRPEFRALILAGARRPARLRAFDPAGLLRHGRRTGGKLPRNPDLARAWARGSARGC
jgi:hypothetical protein